MFDERIISKEDQKKIFDINNSKVKEIIDEYIRICRPSKVSVITDDPKDINYVRELALKNKEEKKLKLDGHTIHFDGIKDQARDKDNTKVLIEGTSKLSKAINTIDRDKGLSEILSLMDGIMEGKEMLVRFFSLGPVNSRFTIPALQLTDSAYVAHSEDLLYRSGYSVFKKLNGSSDFFYLVHSAGKLDERGNSINIENRRIYIDLKENRVLTINNQYAGNSLGLKKLALRLAINKANNEDWLTEHMFIMGVHPIGKNRVTYFTGAFPSACGKTSTAMISGQRIVGDDIAYIRKFDDGTAHAVNIEQGIFGIITDVNPEDDPVIYKTLTTPRELIFSNILIKEGYTYWLGMGNDIPEKGENFSGEWFKGKKDDNGNEIPAAHKNARYTLRISELENVDSNLNNPDGVEISGIIYGGRDSDTSVPVYQSFDWEHGVFIGASIESETTAATLGQEGVRKSSPMANLDFLVVPLGKYLNNHIKFGNSLKKKPLIFSTNYFLKKDGKFLNDKIDKKVWLLWMEGRVYNEFSAIETPIGLIPKYSDLQDLFKKNLNKEYSKEEYIAEFSIRVDKFIEKMDRIEKIYKDEALMPEKFFNILSKIRSSLKEAKEKYGSQISPFEFE